MMEEMCAVLREQQNEKPRKKVEDMIEIFEESDYTKNINEAILEYYEAQNNREIEAAKSKLNRTIKELEQMDRSNLSQLQIAAIHNNLGLAYLYIDELESQNQHYKAIKISLQHIKRKNFSLHDIIDKNTDHCEDEFDTAEWDVLKKKLFPGRNKNDYHINLQELKIKEIDSLEFSKEEYGLQKRLCLKDDYTYEHSLNVCAIALRAADLINENEEFELISDHDKKILAKAAMLHDIGKASKSIDGQDMIDDYILKAYRQGAITKQEFNQIKAHVMYGVDDLSAIYDKSDNDSQRILDIIEKHHERKDGRGYPKKIKLDENDILAQLIAFADTIEAMTAKGRLYQKTMSFDKIKIIFKEHLKKQFDSRILKLVFKHRSRHLLEKEVVELRKVSNNIQHKTNKMLSVEIREKIVIELNTFLNNLEIKNSKFSKEIIEYIRENGDLEKEDVTTILTNNCVTDSTKQEQILAKISKIHEDYHGE